uniref:HMG box domain-containing protein n=1 Tax=Chelonoidis abingdonii TaxID=106734 RepID=A0A8C0GSG5_CHEAB
MVGHPEIKPKGKLSSYLLFFISFKEQYKANQTDSALNCIELSKKCSEKWKTISEEEKKKYEELARVHNARCVKKKRTDPLRGVRRSQRKRRGKRGNQTKRKRPLSAFFLFMAAHRPALERSNPGWSMVEIAKKLGTMWHQQPDKDKEMYKQKAAQLRQKKQKGKAAGQGRSRGQSRKRGGSQHYAPEKKQENLDIEHIRGQE